MFLKSVDEIQQYIPVTASFTYQQIKPSIDRSITKHLEPLLGRALLEDLRKADNTIEASGDSLSADTVSISTSEGSQTIDCNTLKRELITMIERALANLAFYHFIPQLQVQIETSGIHIVTNENRKSAFPWQISDLKKQYAETGFELLDEILDFLEQNEHCFPRWTESDAYSKYKSCFIRTANEFNEHYYIHNSRRLFLGMAPVMKKVERFWIAEALGHTYYDKLKALMPDDALEAKDQKIVELLKPSIANLTVAKSIDQLSVRMDEHGITLSEFSDDLNDKKPAGDERLHDLKKAAHQDGEVYLKIVTDYLSDHISKYPEFKDSPHYKGDSEDSPGFQNPDGSGVFGFF
jgi:hypothetical protein